MSIPVNQVYSYQADFMTPSDADSLFQHLMQYPELTNMAEIRAATGDTYTFNYGKMMFIDKALLDSNALPEAHWGNTVEWDEQILPLRQQIEAATGQEFRTCVCIYYPDGHSGVDFHSDPIAFGDTNIVPSISLGEEREFCLREKQTQVVTSMVLKHGSLVTMKDGCQEYYEHSLPEDPQYLNPRINLTFRKCDY